MRRNRSGLVLAVIIVLLLFRAAVLGGVFAGQGEPDDINRFWQIAQSAGRPYSGYAVEYPVLLLALIKLLAVLAPAKAAFADAIVCIAAAAEMLTLIIAWRTWGRSAAMYLLLANSALYGLFVVRLDLLVTLCALAGAAAAFRKRPRVAAVLLALAVGLKLWPLAVAAVIAILLQGRDRRAYVATLVAALAAGAAATFAVGGTSAFAQVITARGATGWQIESVGGSLVRLFTGEPSSLQQGAERFGHIPPMAGPALVLLALLVCAWIVLHARSWSDAGAAWVGSVAALITASTVFSPQYVAWLLPGAALGWASGRRAVPAAVAGVTLLTVVEDALYNHVIAGTALGMSVLVLRNVALLLTLTLAIRELAMRRAAQVRSVAAFA